VLLFFASSVPTTHALGIIIACLFHRLWALRTRMIALFLICVPKWMKHCTRSVNTEVGRKERKEKEPEKEGKGDNVFGYC
jgi:hypothetical protein